MAESAIENGQPVLDASAPSPAIQPQATSPNGATATEDVVEDPNKLPEDAIETLYVQNLNEAVRIPSTSRSKV